MSKNKTELKVGTKNDSDKVRFELIDPDFIENIAKVLTAGASKYDDFNWARGINYSRVLGALKRHIHEFEIGNEIDEETNLTHLHHAACNLMFLSFYTKHRKEFDDRFFAKERLRHEQ